MLTTWMVIMWRMLFVMALLGCRSSKPEIGDTPPEDPVDDTSTDSDTVLDSDTPGDSDPAVDSDDSGDSGVVDSDDTSLIRVEETFSTPGPQEFVVPTGVTLLRARVRGAGGGGIDALPWSANVGGRGGWVDVELPVAPGDILRLVVGAPGEGASCGGGTTGAGGGGLSGVYDFAGAPLAVAGGGGGAAVRSDGCGVDAPCAGTAFGSGGEGFGGAGAASDASANPGTDGMGAPGFQGGDAGTRGCGAGHGAGGRGGGGGGGGTSNGFGGGGGGSGHPGGAGGASSSGGRAGTNFVSPLATTIHQTSGVGALGGQPGQPGGRGGVILVWMAAP